MSAEDLIEPIEQAEDLDRVADPLHRAIRRLPKGVRSVLGGDWLGHPLHPMLTDLPIGFWTSAWVLDIVGGPETETAADALLGLGVLSAVPTVAAGWVDWTFLDRPTRRVGVVHALSNAVATSLFAGSWLARRRGERARGIALCHAGAVVATVGGFLGGYLAFNGETEPKEVQERVRDRPLDPRDGQLAGVPSDNTTLVSVLAKYRQAGYAADFRPVGAEGEVRCDACGTRSAARSFTDLLERRLEGASDPDDMMLVVAGSCPSCGARGVMTLSYGPVAGEADAAVVSRLP